MRGFLWYKALIARYGVEKTAELTTLAQRLVDNGMFPRKREAVAAIEEQMGLPVTMPVSAEVAEHAHKL
jgi:hypothetical protein